MLKKILQFVSYDEARAEAEAADLSAALQDLGKTTFLSDAQKERMRVNLLTQINDKKLELPLEMSKVADRLTEVGTQVFLNSRQKHLMLSQIKESRQKRGWWSITGFVRLLRTTVASALILFLGLTFFVISPLELRLTKAAKWTFLEDVRGEVFVNRDGRILSVNKDFSLEEGDLVFTRGDSFVIIRYLDDSVTRMGENTSLEIKKLFSHPDNVVNTEVELGLVGGQLWASVYNLVDEDSQFVVETGNASAKVNSKAAFEMKASGNTTSLAVFDNVVDFSKKDGQQVQQVSPVVSGFKAEIDSGDTLLAKANSEVVVQRNWDSEDDWAKLNLDLDQKHESLLKEENNKFLAQAAAKDNVLVGVLSDVKDTTKMMFKNAEIEKARVRFVDANLGFLKAQQILNDAGDSLEKRRTALPYIYEYKSVVKDILSNYAALEKQDPSQARQLFQNMKESVDIQRKSLSLVLPNENLYTAKSVLVEVSANFAINDSEKAQFLLSKASDRLLEVQSLISKNDLKAAEAGFRSYLVDLDDLVSQISSFKVNEVEPKLFALIDEQIIQSKVLSAIEKQLTEKDDQVLLSLVRRVNASNVQKLISIFKAYRKNGIPYEMLVELNNTIGQYYPEGKEKGQYLLSMKELMKTYSEYKNGTELEKIPVELVIDQEGTRNASK